MRKRSRWRNAKGCAAPFTLEKPREPESIREAIDLLGAERIGHGVRIDESSELQERAKAARLPLEMCPLSNVQTRAANSLPEHPIDRLFRKGLHVTVNTDCRTVSLTTLTKEFERLQERIPLGRRGIPSMPAQFRRSSIR